MEQQKQLISKNYLSKLPSVRLSITTETPYFGIINGEGKVSQEAMREFGHAFGRSILRYITADGV